MPPRTSASMQFTTKRACCAAQATRTAWHGDGPSTLTAPTAACRGCPERACGTDTTFVSSPEHGQGVRCKAPGLVAPDVAASGPRSLAGSGRDPMEGHDSDDSVSLQVVAPPFARGREAVRSLSLSPCTSLPACLTLLSASLLRPLFTAPHCLPVAASTLGVGVRQTFFWTSAEHTFPRAPAK